MGSAVEEMRELAERTCPGAISFYDVIPPADCARWIRGAGASLASIRPGIGYDFAKPTKIFAAAACGTPVIFAGIGAGQEVVTTGGLGWAPGYDVAAIAEAMAAVLGQSEAEAAQRSEVCAQWALENASLQSQGRDAARAALASVG
jgi:glycosyltransferase involved in cell wall biosynthesis